MTFYILEMEQRDKLIAIAQRLGDMQTLSSDARRDLMNKLCLIISDMQPHTLKDGAIILEKTV